MPNRVGESKILSAIFGILAGVAVAVISLVVEYKTGWFARNFAIEPLGRNSGSESNSVVLKEKEQEIIALRERISSLEASLKKATDGPVTPSAVGDRVQTVEGFRFEFQDCQHQGPDIYCPFIVTNLRENRELWIDSESRIIDSEGSPHKQCARYFGDKAGGLSYLQVELPNGVPSKFMLKFCGVANFVKAISLLEVKCWGLRAEWRSPKLV